MVPSPGDENQGHGAVHQLHEGIEGILDVGPAGRRDSRHP